MKGFLSILLLFLIIFESVIAQNDTLLYVNFIVVKNGAVINKGCKIEVVYIWRKGFYKDGISARFNGSNISFPISAARNLLRQPILDTCKWEDGLGQIVRVDPDFSSVNISLEFEDDNSDSCRLYSFSTKLPNIKNLNFNIYDNPTVVYLYDFEHKDSLIQKSDQNLFQNELLKYNIPKDEVKYSIWVQYPFEVNILSKKFPSHLT